MTLYTSPSHSPSPSAEQPHFLVLGASATGRSLTLEKFAQLGYLQCPDVPLKEFPTVFHAFTHAMPDRCLVFSVSLNSLSQETDSCLKEIEALKEHFGPLFKVLWLEAPVSTLVQRYVDSGKTHRFELHGNLSAVFELEKSLLETLKPLKDYAISTEQLTSEELGIKIARVLHREQELSPIPFSVTMMSFAFKRGIPTDAEWVLDARFLKNPFYVESLRPFSGLDSPIKEYIHSLPEANRFLAQWTQMGDLLIPLYQKEGKSRLNVAIGCTGGQHRSVCLAEGFAEHIRKMHSDVTLRVVHREKSFWPVPPAACSLN
jgi:RNase adapter protein RapZ